MRSLSVRVRKGEGESVRKKLLEDGLLNQSLYVEKDQDHLYLPVTARPDVGEVEEREFRERERDERDYKVLSQVPEELRALLPTSFDTLGDIAIIRLPDELIPHAKTIGDALMLAFPRLRSVFMDHGVAGELRVRDLEVISGEDRSETVHVEYGLRFKIDPRKAYFNPRLATERRRVASLVREGELVVDMFSGVGPFAIMIAKTARPSLVYAIDLNPEAVELMKDNVQLNKVDRVVPLEGDARQWVFDLPCADRVIMNLPHTAKDFFADALTRLKMGGVMHFYHICEKDEFPAVLDELITQARGMGVEVQVLRSEELKTYSPSASVFSADLLLIGWL
ncbi:MAG TPA: class I SAM-dependent methyltransferase family protein [Methanomassiliicoccales archaeon]|nr:class I SAM-dependent methyltransferase family protein [Methanomassiliicoccales archaeon]